MSGRRCRAVAGPLLLFLLVLAWAAPAPALDIQTVRSPGGIAAWLVEDRKNPIITLVFSFRGGRSSDPTGRDGRAAMVAAMLDEGAGDRDSRAFQQSLEDDAVRLSFTAYADRFTGSLSVLTEASGRAFALLRDALAAPRFDAEPLARVRSQLLARLRIRRERPRTLAGDIWWRAAFPDDPYGRPRDGTEAGLTTLTADDLRDFAARTFTRDRLLVGVVGDIDAERLAGVLDHLFGGLPAQSATEPRSATGEAGLRPARPGEVMVLARDLTQSVAVFGHGGIARRDPDWFAAAILMEIMAGGFGSRLTRELREKRGLAYSVAAWLLPLDRAALVMGSVATRNERVGESMALIRAAWRRIAEEGPSAQEAADAKAHLRGAFPLNLTDSTGIARLLVAIQRHGLGLAYPAERGRLIEQVTPADLRRVAKRLFRPDDLTFAVVGRPEGVTATVAPPDPAR